ncbi:uncharacterized protein LTR77_001677 [Saxophila tyrrhenica]|uniref:Transcription factor CBF/NF-Y/archaeal histone domain-containing protein n=1 Tax=Saxophila tyrrhenica TaxID=1690608 RepID=A0AAV9PP90_9PEZI|nr:hypothetical protein LTR77_001677 [Saxophila tyrrhenica]
MPATTRRMKPDAADDAEYLPDAYSMPVKAEPQHSSFTNGSHHFTMDAQPPPMMDTPAIREQPPADPTLGVQLKTSFPVARIKRLMQADDDIGKVAQVTPHVVSRALELFMIRIISASAAQAAQSGGGSGKGPKRVLAQHVKRALQADENFDFLVDIVAKVPDAPAKAKKEQTGSDSDEGPGSAKKAAPKGQFLSGNVEMVKRKETKRKGSSGDQEAFSSSPNAMNRRYTQKKDSGEGKEPPPSSEATPESPNVVKRKNESRDRESGPEGDWKPDPYIEPYAPTRPLRGPPIGTFPAEGRPLYQPYRSPHHSPPSEPEFSFDGLD